MTDTTAGRGGVGVRLYVSGGEVVKRTFDQVGDSGKKMWAEIALGQKAANPALRALSTGVGEAKAGIRNLSAETGSAGAVLGAFGAAGVAVGAVLGAVAIAATGAFQAMRDAADLTDQAERIGVNAEALQEWRFAAEDAGISADSLNGGMERLNGVLGAFKLGIGDAKLKPVFEELGITQEQLANVDTSDQLLSILADTLGQVRDRAEQVKLARALQIEELLPLLRQGADGIAALRDRSQELGIVLDDEVRVALDAADRQMEITGQQMDTLRVVSLAPLAESLGDAAGMVTDLIVEFGRVEANAPGWVQALQSVGQALASNIRQTAFNAGGPLGTVYVSLWHLAGGPEPLTVQLNVEWKPGMEAMDIERTALQMLRLQSLSLTTLLKFEEDERRP